MKLKRIIKSIFITALALIFVGLAVIAFCDLRNDEGATKPVETIDYKILDKTGDTCAEALDYFYSDLNYNYYFTCIKSDSIYLEWNNGKITKMMDDLNTKKVTINSLLEHGLDAKKELKNE